jgi:hypothetical protein
MTRIGLLQALKKMSEEATKDLLLPVRRQRDDDTDPSPRPASVYLTRLPEMKSSDKKAPYIIHSIITARDLQDQGKPVENSATVRSMFCVYHEDEEEGGLALLNLTERLRIHMLKHVVIEGYELILKQGLELLVYPDDTAPYYMAEMVSTWKLPPVKREVKELWP